MANDEHAGMGGRFEINEAGEKVLVHRTDYVTPVIAPAKQAKVSAQAVAKVQQVKGVK